jgi:hypothetical protein
MFQIRLGGEFQFTDVNAFMWHRISEDFFTSGGYYWKLTRLQPNVEVIGDRTCVLEIRGKDPHRLESGDFSVEVGKPYFGDTKPRIFSEASPFLYKHLDFTLHANGNSGVEDDYPTEAEFYQNEKEKMQQREDAFLTALWGSGWEKLIPIQLKNKTTGEVSNTVHITEPPTVAGCVVLEFVPHTRLVLQIPEAQGGGENLILTPTSIPKPVVLKAPYDNWTRNRRPRKVASETSFDVIIKKVLCSATFQNPQDHLKWVSCLGSPDMKGLHKQKKFLEQIKEVDPLAFDLIMSVSDSHTVDKQVPNRLISAFLDTQGGDATKAAKTIRDAFDGIEVDTRYGPRIDTMGVLTRLPGASTKVQQDLEKRNWAAIQNLEKQTASLGLTAERFPRLLKAILDGHIPTTVFRQPGAATAEIQPVNQEFDLWEEALSQEGWAEEIYSVAQDAARRSTYERDVTPWLLFMLHTLPLYLDKHAGSTGWRCMPKHVSSSWELEMNEADQNGTTKRRSALTPIVDNEARTVTVPYVAMSIGGVRTQWCYSRHYYLFQRGFTDPESGGVVSRDLEEKLNGKDDYGLMYYDLNGTSTAQGYPTFLIIFERRVGGTHVHIHRTHPCRSRNGVKTPACRLIEACYQYMAGNVPASEIVAQQGDIMLLSCVGDLTDKGIKMEEGDRGSSIVFESHIFRGPLVFYRSTAKTPKNRLGFIHAPDGLHLEHPEHDHTPRLPGGWYEIRRAVSWEANPVSIQVLSID